MAIHTPSLDYEVMDPEEALPRRAWPILHRSCLPVSLYKSSRNSSTERPASTNDATHRVSIHGIVSRNGKNADIIAHDNMLALPNDPETGLFQRPHCVLMIDAGDFRHV